MTSYNELLNNLEILKLDKIRSFLPNYLEEITQNEIPFTEALLELTQKEMSFRDERASKIQISVLEFPFERTFKTLILTFNHL
ncbi:MAG: hypothetical protein RBR71_11860 [Gudongella sp.]|nr:hypothetical protein [Gudongella sp.]